MAIVKNATFEVGVENHVNWFSASVAQDTGDSHGGTGSLLVTTTAAFGSGVQLDVVPYYPITALNSYDFELWYKESTATMPTVTWNIEWLDNAGATIIATDTISMPRATSWTRVAGSFTAPDTSFRLRWTFTWGPPASGPAFRVDDLLVQDTPAAGAGALPMSRRRQLGALIQL